MRNSFDYENRTFFGWNVSEFIDPQCRESVGVARRNLLYGEISYREFKYIDDDAIVMIVRLFRSRQAMRSLCQEDRKALFEIIAYGMKAEILYSRDEFDDLMRILASAKPNTRSIKAPWVKRFLLAANGAIRELCLEQRELDELSNIIFEAGEQSRGGKINYKGLEEEVRRSYKRRQPEMVSRQLKRDMYRATSKTTRLDMYRATSKTTRLCDPSLSVIFDRQADMMDDALRSIVSMAVMGP
jgi:hypothetical protein